MKNIHILPTDKPSRLKSNKNVFDYSPAMMFIQEKDWKNQNIYIINDEEIIEGDYWFDGTNIRHDFPSSFVSSIDKKIILTTDQDLDGVQAIDDDFLEWFVKNPSCESVKWNAYPISLNGNIVATNRPYPFEGLISNFKIEYKIIIPKEEPKQETTMNNEFVSYEIALKLKELGFNEPCICGYNEYHLLRSKISSSFDGDFVKWDEKYDRDLKAPLYQQVFKWFREKFNWQVSIEATKDQHSHELGYNYWIWNSETGLEYHTMPMNKPSGDWEFKTYEEAELACLMKLIEINS